MERKRTQSVVILDDDEEEEGKDWKSSARSRKKVRYIDDSEGEEEESEEKEEEKEENKDRRISPRKIKRPIYTVDFNDYDEDDEDEDEDEDDDEDEEKQEEDHDNNKNWDKDEEDNEQPGPSTKNTHNQGTCEHSFLTVTCGTKTGILDVKKLERSEECIKSRGHWFSPPAFEHFAGKSSAKKWKSSILHEDKPLQFLFEQGALTTKGYNKRRRRKTTKQMKLLSPNYMSSESSSEETEIHSVEETEEDGVEDEDWFPSSEELLRETEKVKGGVENGEGILDSGDEKSKEEEDEKEKGEVEDEDMTPVADNDNSGFEEMEAESISSIPEKSALLKKVEVVITRLSKMEYPAIIKGAEEEKEKEFPQSNERKDDGQREITTENGNTLTPVHPPATSSQDIKPKTEDTGSTSNHAANLSLSCVRFSAIDMKETGDCEEKDKERQRREMGPEIQTQWLEGFGENSDNEHVSMSRSEASDHPVAATSLMQGCVKEEGGESLDALVECKYENTDATSFNNDAAQLQVQLDTSIQTTQTSDVTQTWVMVEVPSCQPSTSCDLDTMDLDQLRREKIKMQIKVLRLQEEYYTRKIKELKN